MRTRKTIIFILLGIAAVILFVIDMATGEIGRASCRERVFGLV